MPRERAIIAIIKHITSVEPAILIVGLTGAVVRLLVLTQGFACNRDEDRRRQSFGDPSRTQQTAPPVIALAGIRSRDCNTSISVSKQSA